MYSVEIFGLAFLSFLQLSVQKCPEEFTYKGIRVKWSETSTAYHVESDPLCYVDGHPLKRNCTNGKWSPPINEVGPCLKVLKTLNITSCPPGYRSIYGNNDYCYGISPESAWNSPCFTSGGATVITDLNEQELDSLIDSLLAANISRYFWLPAQRSKLFNPVLWSIPGPNWGVQVIANDHIRFNNLIWKNCLALDVELRILTTDLCTQKYPNLCFYINSIHYPATCPTGYHAFRYKPDNGTCYGIEKSESESGMTFEEFRHTKCEKPMSDNQIAFNRFIFMKLAELSELPDQEWCWYKSPFHVDDEYDVSGEFEGIINYAGTSGMKNSSSKLSCMACEADVIYGDTELMFEYNEADNQIYLTIYFPSGLWKYDFNDKGIQCFSDAKGFVKVVDINDLPYLSIRQEIDDEMNYIEKIVYIVDLVAQRSAQYWCEGHTFNLSLISTDKIIVNPKGKDIHVFALTVKYHNFTYEVQSMPEVDFILHDLTEKLNAQKILWMDIYELTCDYITILLHVHISVMGKYDKEYKNIQGTYDMLKENALEHLPAINCSFVNLTSSLYCLPTTSNDSITLDWELTAIGHITAPKQFCLQKNGLPVKRQCLGSYHYGAIWGEVEGRCDSSYKPTRTTTYLYSVGKGQLPSNYTDKFLTEGLGHVLSDVDLIIPADIFYLSMSLQHIILQAQDNDTCVDLGDIDNMAWVMDRVMEFDYDYLRLSQTLNSTNVIVNSVNDIIELIAEQPLNYTNDNNDNLVTTKSSNIYTNDAYQLAVAPQFIVQISYPMFTNVTGMVISRTNKSKSFTNMVIEPLYANTTLDDVLAIDNLEVAAWVPLNLLKSLKPNTNESIYNETQIQNIHIIISAYENDVVFQELLLTDHKINSRIIGISIPGYISNLEYPLPIVFNGLKDNEYKKLCGFWDFETKASTTVSGSWKTQGCYPVKSRENITICQCYHLTHFSQLISLPQRADKKEELNGVQHTKALNIITLVGCFLSILGIVGIWITALVFANWRKKPGTKVLLQLSTAILLPLIFIVVFNLDNNIFVEEDGIYTVASQMKPRCIILGALLHYSILSSFMWMLLTAILQFVRYVRVLGVSRPSRFMFKFSLVGWGIPILPVIIVLALDVENYIPEASHCKRLCYPNGFFYLVGVLVPICIILCINVVLFLLVIHSISRGTNDKTKATDMDLVAAQLRLSIFLFFLLGLTWIFGILSFTTNLLWSYLFCLTSTLQGFVLFIYFIICDPMTRNMWITLVKPPFNTNSSRNSITSLN